MEYCYQYKGLCIDNNITITLLLSVQTPIPFHSASVTESLTGQLSFSSALMFVFSETKFLNTFLFQERLFCLFSYFPPFLCEQFSYIFICFSESQNELSSERRQILSLVSDLTDTKTKVSYWLWHQKNAVLFKPMASFSDVVNFNVHSKGDVM